MHVDLSSLISSASSLDLKHSTTRIFLSINKKPTNLLLPNSYLIPLPTLIIILTVAHSL